MAQKNKIGITLSDETTKRLDFVCKELGLKRSQAIAFAINTIAMEKYGYTEKGESNESK